ncbi:hypothetical protein IWW37_002038 [Coemansia sp. RSA 2050]|nr:hypothetical protein IWW37_002038 [Coemansia sp. RSA 2050]
MRTLLIIVLLAVVGFGLPGVLDLGKLLGGVGLLDDAERLLTNDGASPRATSLVDTLHNSKADTTHNQGKPSSKTTAQTAHLSTTAEETTDTSNIPRLTGINDALGQKSLLELATKELVGKDTVTQEGASESRSTFEEFGILEDAAEDVSRASADELFTTSSNVQDKSVPKTVVHTQFVVVAPGERSTLLIAEPESFSAMDNSAYALSPLSAIDIAVFSLVAILCQ